MNAPRIFLAACFVAAMAVAQVAPAAEKGRLKAGAAKIDITPSIEAGLTMSGYAGRTDPAEGIFDRLYCRAVVLDDGGTRAAIIVAGLSSIGDSFWDEMAARIARETGIPKPNILLAATHTHAGPKLAYQFDEPEQNVVAYTDEVAEKIMTVVKQASERLEPALMGVGAGRAAINMNRRARMVGGAYWLGKNPDGPSDKTVHVVKFAAQDGSPIAILVNYGVHCTSLGSKNLRISGDVAGATSRYIEAHYGGGVVVPWTSGAGGDQNPIYNQQTVTKRLYAMGEILGEEVIRVEKDLRMSPLLRIQAAQQVLSLPGRELAQPRGFRADGVYEFRDADPIEVRLSLLMLNHVALCGVSGEVLTGIGMRLKNESPFAQTIMITHCNGSKARYIPDDEAYEIMSYEIASAPMKQGAEGAIVKAFLDMMDKR